MTNTNRHLGVICYIHRKVKQRFVQWRVAAYLIASPLLFLAVFLTLLLNSPATWGQSTDSGVDIRLVLDISGSMKRNDPANLRRPAVDLLIRLLPEDSYAGVWTFGQQASALVPHQKVDEGWRELARSQISHINSTGLYTNIGEALEKAGAPPTDDNYSKSVILLTDGMVDISKDAEENQREWRRIADEVIPALQAGGVTVHTIGLSDNADSELMEELALATGGMMEVVKNADELMQAFLQAFDIAAPAQEVPMTDNRFAVDSSVEEFTALIFRETASADTRLISPDGTEYDSLSQEPGLRWHRGDTYDLITVSGPLEGVWTIVAEIAPRSRVTVVSDLRLRVNALPSNMLSGSSEKLRFVLQDAGQTITDNAFLSVLSNSAQLSYGTEGADNPIWSVKFPQQEPPEDGIYSADLPPFDLVGVYELAVLVDGKTFQRRFRQSIDVRGPFSVELVEKVSEEGERQMWISVRSHLEALDPRRTQMAATVTNPLRRKRVIPLEMNDDSQWQGPVRLDKPGKHTIEVRVTGEDDNGVPFEYNLTPLTVDYDPNSFELLSPAVQQTGDSSSAVSSSSSSLPLQEETPPQETESEESDSRLTWVFYLVIAMINAAIIGGGFYLYRKLFAGGRKPRESEEFPETADGEAGEFELEDESMSLPTNDFDDSAMMMDSGDAAEEEPPMEDFDLAAADEEDLSMAGDETSTDDQPDEGEVVSSQVEQDENDLYVVDEDDLLGEMLKTQGVEEDDLDDAITSLIDELSGIDDMSDDGDEPDDDDDFDFDDEDRF